MGRPSKKQARHEIGWPEAIDAYLTSLRAARKSRLTVDGYRREIERLRMFLSDRRVETPAQVTLTHLREYLIGLQTGATSRSRRPNKAGTVHRISTTLSGFFRFLTAEELIPRDPSLRLERPRLPRRDPGAVLTTKEVQRLLGAPEEDTPKGLRDRALLEILYGAGLRRAEALDLALGDLDHAEREVHVRGKGDKARILPVTRAAWGVLVRYLQRARPALATDHADSARLVFLSTLGRRMSDQSILKLLRRYARAARIEKRLTPHTLRRTFATHLLKGGANLRAIQLLLGHEKLSTTALYLRLDSRDLRREILTKHPRERMDA